MHDQISITADRRGKMRVAAEIESEVAVIFRGILGLRLGAQDNFVDQLFGITAFYAGKNTVEGFRLEYAALGKRNVERLEEFTQCLHFLHRRLVVHAIDEGTTG